MICLLLSACDDEPGTTDVLSASPSIESLSVTPSEIQFLPSDGQKDTVIIFEINASVNNVADAEGVNPQFIIEELETEEIIAEGQLSSAPNSQGDVAATAETSISTTTVSNWRLNVFLFDQRGRGNRIETSIPIRGFSNNPPQIESVAFPDTVARPESGSQPFSLVARVIDEDGQNTIQSVTVELINPDEVSTGVFTMRDDGSAESGDETAGDSLFTVTFSVNPDSRAGVFDLIFQAQDLAGLQSETVERQIVIE